MPWLPHVDCIAERHLRRVAAPSETSSETWRTVVQSGLYRPDDMRRATFFLTFLSPAWEAVDPLGRAFFLKSVRG